MQTLIHANICIEHILTQLESKFVAKGEILLKPKQAVEYAYFVRKGLLRAYYIEKIGSKDQEVTPWIVPDPGFLTDVTGFLLDQKSTIYIEALEDTEIFILSKKQYLVFHEKYQDIRALLFDRSLIKAEQRVKMLYLKSPEKRLELMEKMYPGLQGRLSVNTTASFINVDPSTLSRIRAKKL